jgi:hypothetical protein
MASHLEQGNLHNRHGENLKSRIGSFHRIKVDANMCPLFRPVVFNLGYASPRGTRRRLRGYLKLKKYDFVLNTLINN